jgi:hypothetical protein
LTLAAGSEFAKLALLSEASDVGLVSVPSETALSTE